VVVEDTVGVPEGSPPDRALMAKDAAAHYCLSHSLDTPVMFGGADFVLQYTVRFSKPLACGGAYIKLLSASPDLDLEAVTDATPYTILFGPDKCGADQ
jgi:calnexin